MDGDALAAKTTEGRMRDCGRETSGGVEGAAKAEERGTRTEVGHGEEGSCGCAKVSLAKLDTSRVACGPTCGITVSSTAASAVDEAGVRGGESVGDLGVGEGGVQGGELVGDLGRDGNRGVSRKPRRVASSSQ